MIKSNFLNIINLSVLLDKKQILNNLNLIINRGEKHVIMGPNGVGKSTLAKILTGWFKNYIISGEIIYNNNNLLELTPDILSLKGIFLSFQYPIEIQGLSNFEFLKSMINAKRKYEKLDPIENKDLLLKIKKFMEILKIKEEFLYRSVNEAFSGGEKKKNEILQMALLEPNFIILDEIDSGLDVDSLKTVFNCINSIFNNSISLMIITHYSRILEYIDVDFVHIMHNGKIIKTGEKSLALDINTKGYCTD